MSRVRAALAPVVVLALAVAACEQQAALAPDGESVAPAASTSEVLDGNDGCTPTGSGLDAVVVNQDLTRQTVDVGDCDVGAYFDQDGVVEDATFLQDDDEGAPKVQYAVRVDGAHVEVTASEVDVVDDFGPQFVAIGYRNGATGRITDNVITGFHRAGILLDGEGTEAVVSGNIVTGVGPKTSGWAENGIQLSRGATGTVRDNEVRDHWWDLNNFTSSGIIVFGSHDVTVQGNALAGNDAAFGLTNGDNANFIHNQVDVTDEDGDASGIFHAGAVVFSGENVGFRQNEFTSGSPAGSVNVGIFVTAAAENTKLIRNTFEGEFSQEIVDQGEATKLPDPFDPES
jgi:hypothetical protein